MKHELQLWQINTYFLSPCLMATSLTRHTWMPNPLWPSPWSLWAGLFLRDSEPKESVVLHRGQTASICWPNSSFIKNVCKYWCMVGYLVVAVAVGNQPNYQRCHMVGRETLYDRIACKILRVHRPTGEAFSDPTGTTSKASCYPGDEVLQVAGHFHDANRNHFGINTIRNAPPSQVCLLRWCGSGGWFGSEALGDPVAQLHCGYYRGPKEAHTQDKNPNVEKGDYYHQFYFLANYLFFSSFFFCC